MAAGKHSQAVEEKTASRGQSEGKCVRGGRPEDRETSSLHTGREALNPGGCSKSELMCRSRNQSLISVDKSIKSIND